jgi:hypothetical protein
MSCSSLIFGLHFSDAGYVPTLKDGNSKETVFNPPWRHEPVAIGLHTLTIHFFLQVECGIFVNQLCFFTGSRFGEAFQEPASFIAIKPLFEVPSRLLHLVCCSM